MTPKPFQQGLQPESLQLWKGLKAGTSRTRKSPRGHVHFSVGPDCTLWGTLEAGWRRESGISTVPGPGRRERHLTHSGKGPPLGERRHA